MSIELSPFVRVSASPSRASTSAGRYPDADAAAIVKAMDDYSVLVFRDTHLDDAAHVRFSEIFGYVERYPSSIQKVLKGENASQEAPAEYGSFINGITNMTADGRISDDPERRILFAADRYWHTDSSFIAQRAGYSALLAHVVPPEGELTWFADLRAACRRPPRRHEGADRGLEAEHCMWWSRILGGYAMTEEMAMRMPAAAHPIVHRLRSGRARAATTTWIGLAIRWDHPPYPPGIVNPTVTITMTDGEHFDEDAAELGVTGLPPAGHGQRLHPDGWTTTCPTVSPPAASSRW